MTTLSPSLLYVDGQLRPAAQNRTFDNVGPWTGTVVGQAADASRADVEEAIIGARRAFDTTNWSRNHARRLELVAKLYDLLLENRERLVEIARLEGGAPMGAVKRAQVDWALQG